LPESKTESKTQEKEKTMPNTYKLAKETEFSVIPFGPYMSLEKAEYYQGQMEKGGFPVLIVNMDQGGKVKTKTIQEKIAAMLKKHSLLTV
jgi:hypothetical protein